MGQPLCLALVLLVTKTQAFWLFSNDEAEDAFSSMQVPDLSGLTNRGAISLQKYQDSGPCWSSLISTAEFSCKSLNEESLARLSVGMLNCHLRQSGLSSFDCGLQSPVPACIAALEAAGRFESYTSFFIEALEICQYLHRERFREESGSIVATLFQSAKLSSAQLEQVLLNTNTMAASLVDAEERQRELGKGQAALSSALATSRAEEAARWSESRDRLDQLNVSSQTMTQSVNESLAQLSRLDDGQERVLASQQRAEVGLDRVQTLSEQAAEAQHRLLAAQTSMADLVTASSSRLQTTVNETVKHGEKLLLEQASAAQSLEQLQASQAMAAQAAQASLAHVVQGAVDARAHVGEITDGLSEVLAACRAAMRFQQLVANEVFGFKTFLLYSLAILFTITATSPLRTRSARLPIMVVVAVSLTLERWLVPHQVTSTLLQHRLDPLVVPNHPYSYWDRVWVIRRSAMALCLGGIVRAAATYVDQDALRTAMLQELVEATRGGAVGQIQRPSPSPFALCQPSHLPICNCGAPAHRHLAWQCFHKREKTLRE